MKPQSILAPFDEHAHEFIEGLDAIAGRARYGSNHFLRRYLYAPGSLEALSTNPLIVSHHTNCGHFFEVGNKLMTHPTSATAWGQNIRVVVAEKRRGRVPGWLSSGGPTVSTGGTASIPVATASMSDPAATTWFGPVADLLPMNLKIQEATVMTAS